MDNKIAEVIIESMKNDGILFINKEEIGRVDLSKAEVDEAYLYDRIPEWLSEQNK